MTTTDFFYYLLLGILLGISSTLQGLLGQRAKAGSRNDGEGGLDAALRSICALERATDLDPLLKLLTNRYETIAMAFTAGAIAECPQPMSDAIRGELSAVLAARCQRDEAGGVRLITACAARIVDADVAEGSARLSIAFTAWVEDLPPLRRKLDTQAVEAADIWTFERSTDRRQPEWLLVATEPVG